MTLRAIATSPRTAIGIFAVAVATTWLAGGGAAGMGMALGLVGAGFSIGALWLLIRTLGRTPPDSARARFAIFLIVVAFFAKLPLYMVLGALAHGLGGAAPTCFLLGVGLVYCCLVGWALAQG